VTTVQKIRLVPNFLVFVLFCNIFGRGPFTLLTQTQGIYTPVSGSEQLNIVARISMKYDILIVMEDG
jgi:hypothetical protein